MAERFLDEKTAGLHAPEVSVPANQSLHLTAAALRLSEFNGSPAAAACELGRSGGALRSDRRRIDRSHLASTGFGVVGPTRPAKLAHGSTVLGEEPREPYH